MSDRLKVWIKLITNWIVTYFLRLVPKITGCRMGTAQIGDKGRSFLADFFPNLRKLFSFSFLPTAYGLLPTASPPPPLFRGRSLSQSGHSLSKPGQPLSKQGQSLSQQGQSLSPQALLLSPGGELLSPERYLLLSFKRGLRQGAGDFRPCIYETLKPCHPAQTRDEDALKPGAVNREP